MKYTEMQKSQLAYEKMENQQEIPVLSESKQFRMNVPVFGLPVGDCNISILYFFRKRSEFCRKNINFNHSQDLLIF